MAQPRFLQAVMEIVLQQKYVSWQLPKGWTVILTENPSDGTYDVQDTDAANKSRYSKFLMKYDVETWANWAEKQKIDGRAINFMLMNPEIIDPKNQEINPRAFENFFNSIKYIEDFTTNIPLITKLGEGAIGSDATHLFVMFVENKLDKLITPKQMLDTSVKHEEVLETIDSLINGGSEYRGDIAYTLINRLVNYVLETPELKITPAVVERVGKLITSKVFGADLNFIITKKVIRITEFFALLDIDELTAEILA